MSDLQLKVDGQLYGGWKTIKVKRGIRRFSDHFSLTLTDLWSGQSERRPIEEDSPCQVLIDDEQVITGYVDDIETSYSDKEHSITVTGRAKTGDLIDCSQKEQSWSVPMKLERLATELCKPFGIDVITEVDTGEPLNRPALEPGETVHEFLSRLTAYRAVMLTSNANGDLVITRASQQRITTALVLGENVLRATGKRSKLNRFHTYTVRGQHAGNDFSYGVDAAHIEGKAIDKHVRQQRSIYIEPGDLTLHDAKRIAEYERNIRYGESQPTTYTVNGWKHKDGLWLPNKMVPVVDKFIGIESDLLITHVTYIMGEEGELTELEVMPREALDIIALPEKESKEVFF